MLVSALVRLATQEGGNATVIAKGDETAGSILIVCAHKGQVFNVLERVSAMTGGMRWVKTGPQHIDNQKDVDDYILRRQASDTDLWAVELDIPNAERFTALLADLA
jgi:hypothetical protein